jgi:hypothetical protein
MKVIARCAWSFRAGDIEAVFICHEYELEQLYGHVMHLGEVLGKHSEVTVEIGGPEDVEILCKDQGKIAIVEEIFGTSIAGINPFDYLDPEEAEENDEFSEESEYFHPNDGD